MFNKKTRNPKIMEWFGSKGAFKDDLKIVPIKIVQACAN